jgi:4-coumarate--CoA ligase
VKTAEYLERTTALAAGLRCTLANSAYTPDELGFQYTDSRARIVVTTPDGLNIVRQMFAAQGINGDDRIIVITNGFGWAGGPESPVPSELRKYTLIGDLFNLGKLPEEEKFDGQDCHETAFLCYSSGTTGKPKVYSLDNCLVPCYSH